MKPLKILKFIIVAMLLSFVGFIAFRIMMTSDRSTLKEICLTESNIAAYKADGKDAFLASDIPNDMSADGYYTAYAMTFCPEGEEIQITVRYNDSLFEKYLPGATAGNIYFVLKDKDGNEVSKAKTLAEKERYFYNHLRLSFEDVVLSEDSELYLFLCCDESDPPYPANHNKGILLVHPSVGFEKRKLSAAEKELFENAD